MDAPETFPRPPITEALIDIQVANTPETGLERLESFHEVVKAEFPNKQKRIVQAFQVITGDAPQSSVKASDVQGFMFFAADKAKIVQAGLTSFTFNKLKPYSNWESFSTEAKERWKQYLDFAKPINVTRIGLRYINKIEIPLPLQKLEKYIASLPAAPADATWGLAGFFMQMSLKNLELPFNATVTHAFNPLNVAENLLPYILDIDVWAQFSVLAPETEKMWEHLNLMRDLKNKIFFSSITEETRKLFR